MVDVGRYKSLVFGTLRFGAAAATHSRDVHAVDVGRCGSTKD